MLKDMYNITVFDFEALTVAEYIFYIFNNLLSIFGILGNGMIIWILGFHTKKNHFTTYILNLAIADFSLLTNLMMFWIPYFFPQIFHIFHFLLMFLDCSTFSTSQLLLTAISIDRCVSVFFPLWHRLHRPKHLSTILCVLIWVVSLVPPATDIILTINNIQIHKPVVLYQFLVNGLLCLPLMIISSLMLFIKVCCRSKQQRKGRLLITILITVFFFCCVCFPINVFFVIAFVTNKAEAAFNKYAILCAYLNSSANPVIYYLGGRSKTNKSIKAAIQKLFKEVESTTTRNPAGISL